MPTTDDHAPRRRRALGRGPGTGTVQPPPEPAEHAEPPAFGVGAEPPGIGQAPQVADAPDAVPSEPAKALTTDAPTSPAAAPPPECGHAPAAEEAAELLAHAAPVASSTAAAAAAARQGAVVAARNPPGTGEPAAEEGRFTVRLKNFEGPFDLLLQLISKHKLDVTEVALSKVTDEFIAHIHAMGPDWELDQATEFLVVAATLLDLKAARLLPAAEVEDEEDLALLEARDLLFARLLQYRAYKQIAAIFADRLEAEALSYPRTVGLEPHHAELLPEVVISIGAEGFAKLAVKAMQPKPRPQVYVDHIHAPLVSVREQAELIIARLRELGGAYFQELTADAPDILTVVARFLALLELYREKAVALDQPEALGALLVRWTGGDLQSAAPLVTDEFDQEPGKRKDERDEPDQR